jgi:hypothetical protein
VQSHHHQGANYSCLLKLQLLKEPIKIHRCVVVWQQIRICIRIYRVSQEECARLRESVSYVKIYRYNPKHLYPKLNGYGDNGQRKVRSSCGSTYCTCSVDALRVHCACPSFVYRQLSHAATLVSTCIVLGTLRTTTALMRSVYVVQCKAVCHSCVNYMLSTDINITETTYSCQF